MIARFNFVIPRPFHLQCTPSYEPIELKKGGYQIVIHAPVTSEFEMYPPLENSLSALEMVSMVRPSEESLLREDLTVDGEPSIEASLLQIDFHAENFKRGAPAREVEPRCDPPMEFVLGIVNELLTAMRLIGRAGEIKKMTTPGMWCVHYLDDHGNPLPRDGKNVLGHYGAHVERTVNSITHEMWQRLPEVLAELNPPSWRSLLLDAQAILPEAGSAIILIATALEVLIAAVLRHRADQAK